MFATSRFQQGKVSKVLYQKLFYRHSLKKKYVVPFSVNWWNDIANSSWKSERPIQFRWNCARPCSYYLYKVLNFSQGHLHQFRKQSSLGTKTEFMPKNPNIWRKRKKIFAISQFPLPNLKLYYLLFALYFFLSLTPCRYMLSIVTFQ